MTLDVAAAKWLWGRACASTCCFRNVFNDAVPHHPIGAAYGRTFMVQRDVLLDWL